MKMTAIWYILVLMHGKRVIIQFIIFIFIFSLVFWIVRMLNILPESKLSEDLKSIPTLFAAGNFIYSIFTAFIMQAQWQKWNTLNDANKGELNMLHQLFVVAHHFPVKERNEIRFHIYKYIEIVVTSTKQTTGEKLDYRSKEVDQALIRLEDTMFVVSKKHPDIGTIAFNYLTRAMEYREQKLHSVSQRLPIGIKMFVIFSTFVIISGSLFLPFNAVGFNYYFTLIIAILAFGLYLMIDDFDHPFRRDGIQSLSLDGYIHLMQEIHTKLEQYHFDFANAEKQENTDTFYKT